jgi:7,8-dihydroneopterin aldolase/epimerase/oxygenase
MSSIEKVKPLPSAVAARTMQVFIRDLVLPCRVGIHQHERLAQQRVRINVSLTCIEHPAIDDDVDNIVCYAGLMSGIKGVVGGGHVNLVETLADRIAALCLEDHRILSVKVRVEKLDAFKEAESVGIEIERQRSLR